jgi:hypothetical protein
MKKRGSDPRSADYPARDAIALASLVSALATLAACGTTGTRGPDIEKAVARVAKRSGTPSLTVGPIASDLRMFRMITARGKARELGRALGMIGIESGYPFPAVAEEHRERNQAIIALYRDIYPAYLERAAGVAEIYGRKLEDLDLAVMENSYFARMGLEGYDLEKTASMGFPACSVVATRSSDGRTVVGRNLDTFNLTLFLVRSEVEGSYRSLNTAALAFHGYALDGINEKGVFIGEMTIVDPAYAGILSPAYPKRPSVFSHHMMRIVLDTCASVDEAVALFSRVPVWFTDDPWHFFLADAAGNFAVVEYDKTGQLAITRPAGGVLVSLNTPLMEGRESLMKDPRYPIADKYVRVHGADGIAAHVSMAELMKQLALREDNPNYPSVIGIRATVWTSTYDLVDRTMVIRYWEDGYKEHRLGF